MHSTTRLPRAALQRTFNIANRTIFIAAETPTLGDTQDSFGRCGVPAFDHFQKVSEDPVDIELLVNSQRNGSSPTPQILCLAISSCAKSGFLGLGVQIHAAVIKFGLYSSVYICSALVDMYGKCRVMKNAEKMFDEIPVRNVVTWNSMISGYLHGGCPQMAVGMFVNLLRLGIAPTPFTLSGVLVGCSQLEARDLGTQVHAFCLKTRCWSNVVVGSGLIDIYSKCVDFGESRRVFDLMPDKNVVSWTAMVSGYAQNLQPAEAMRLVREMLRLDLMPNAVTYNSLLSSFSSPSYWDQSRQIHCRIIREGLETNPYLAITLAVVYAECGSSLEDFRKVSSSITKLDSISYNAVIAGLSNLGSGEEAFECFTEMRRAGVNVDVFTFTSILRAVGIIPGLEEGRQIHALVYKTGQPSNINVQNGLVSMYARCGAISDSKRAFSTLKEPDLISWNSLLSGCAHHGFGREAVELFEEMRRTDQVKPDDTTYLAVLTACSHFGLLDKGLEYFKLMTNADLPVPRKMEHYSTIVDLFSRSGNLDEAETFIQSMPIEPGPSVYRALLSACQVHGNKEIALRTAKKLLELYPNDPSTYVLLSNALLIEGYWDDAAVVRRLMCDRGVRKSPGYSRI